MAQHGEFVRVDGRLGVVLEVTREVWEKTDINTAAPGLFVFSGMWYGDDPLDHKSFGKILSDVGEAAGMESVGTPDDPDLMIELKPI